MGGRRQNGRTNCRLYQLCVLELKNKTKVKRREREYNRTENLKGKGITISKCRLSGMKFPSGRENKGKIKSSPGQNNH